MFRTLILLDFITRCAAMGTRRRRCAVVICLVRRKACFVCALRKIVSNNANTASVFAALRDGAHLASSFVYCEGGTRSERARRRHLGDLGHIARSA